MSVISKHEFGDPSWFDLMSPDLAKAQAFYAGLFNWTYTEGTPESGGYTMARLGDKNVCGVGPIPPGAPFPSAWTVYFNVESADATAELIKANGGTMMMPSMDVMDAGRMGVATDPSGAMFGLWQPKKHKGADVRDEHGAMGWQDCHTRDAAKARDFYARVFKLEPVKTEGMEYWTLHRGKATVAGVMQNDAMPAQVPPHWMAYFYVDNTDATVAKATATGGSVVVPPFDTPHGRIAVLADPFGATFSVCKPPA